MRQPPGSGRDAETRAQTASIEQPVNPKRRRFLLTLGVGSAGAAAAAAGGLPSAVAAEATSAAAEEQDSGYRETQHVRDYYRSAKI